MTRANPLDAALDEFEVKPRADRPRVAPEAIEQIAKENGFVSRDAAKLEAPARMQKQRRFKTGRNQQINIKATGATIERFTALADRLQLPSGALLERAVELLEEHYRNR
ncbi:hypothetical protein L602_001500000910 [Cupriavidus gilardii J11]|uniref:Stability/partitioning determinant n=1 Tax=Cupriavidus gilardii J11 TaxID=936133 RepID=A0A562BRR1_9BURK|nr:stability/partitioning determinant [Cupriavidus gilardii]TWG87958.1 hypothetical protein L602_001500000910 [Cupriavidus gilardii J11]